MSNTPGIGPAMAPLDYDGSRISPEIRQALKDQAPGIAAGVTRTADQPASPGRGDSRPDWRQPGSYRR
jgi:hypothetical protein